MKSIVKNEHREMFTEKRFDEIPRDALAILQEQEKDSKKTNENHKEKVSIRTGKHSSDNAS